MDNSNHFTRFRTPCTSARLRQMYDNAIDMPLRPTLKGPDATAPSSTPSPNDFAHNVPAQTGNRLVDTPKESLRNREAREAIWIHHAYLITDIGHRKYRVETSKELGAAIIDYKVPKLAAMFPVYAAVCVRFAKEEDVELEGFIACAVYELCKPPYAAQRHNVYMRLAFECFYQTYTEFPQFLSNAIQGTWSYPREVFTKFIPTHLRQ